MAARARAGAPAGSSRPAPKPKEAPARSAPGNRGARTRRRLLEAAETVFTALSYHDASIVKITEAAGVAQGTFYLYFASKQAIFEELVDDLNSRVRHAMGEAAAGAGSRLEAERHGFEAFFRFTAEHPGLYRVIRQAEFVSPASLHRHYQRIAEGYVGALQEAMREGQIAQADPDVVAWCLMGVGELVGMRWILWEGRREMPAAVFEQTMGFIGRGLGGDPA
jgi:AcrR family transcriptional regulator